MSEGFIGDVSSRRALFGSGSFGFGGSGLAFAFLGGSFGSGSGLGFSLGSGDFGFLLGYGFGLSFVLSLFFGQTCLSLLFFLSASEVFTASIFLLLSAFQASKRR